MVGAGAGAEARCLSRVWGLFLLSAFPAHDSTQGWACRFPVAAWESWATWRAGQSPCPHHLVPSDSHSGTQGAGDACELSTPRTTQSSRSSHEQSCYLHGEDETKKQGGHHQVSLCLQWDGHRSGYRIPVLPMRGNKGEDKTEPGPNSPLQRSQQ